MVLLSEVQIRRRATFTASVAMNHGGKLRMGDLELAVEDSGVRCSGY